MDSYVDTWVSNTSQMSKSIAKDTAQSTSASNIVGRKLNCFLRGSKRIGCNNPRIVERSINSSRGRMKDDSRSPLRSTSRSVKGNRSSERIKECSPTRLSKFKKEKVSFVKNENRSKKNLLNECSNIILRERSDNLRKTLRDTEKKQVLKEKLVKVNKKIREKNKKCKKKCRKEKELEGTIKKDENAESSRENDKLRAKIRAEREASRQAGRKAIGLEYFSHLKIKKVSPVRPEKQKQNKSPDPAVKKYMNSKKKTQRLAELQQNLEETLRERERLHTLDKLDKSSRLRKSPKRSKKCVEKSEVFSSIIKLAGTKKKTERKLKKKQNFHISSDCLSEKLKDLQERINSNYDLMKVKAATKIQHWFRQVLYYLKRNNVAHHIYTNTPNTPIQPIFSSQETPTNSPHPSSPLHPPLVSTILSTFQLKRPKQLNMDLILSPHLTNPTENSNPQATVALHSQALIHSANSSSTQVIVNISQENPALSTPSHSGSAKNESLHSFTVPKVEVLELSDNNSIENDISELSSALIRTQLNESSKSEVKETLNQVPVTSLDISCNVSDIAEELLANELELFIKDLKFVLKDPDVDPTEAFIEVYLKTLFEELSKHEEDILELINTPGFVDPLSKLELLQCTDVGQLSKQPTLEIILPGHAGSVARSKLGNKVRTREIYLQMLFDCVNEALNHVRPFGVRGVPDPWVAEPRLLFGEGDLRRVQRLVKNVVEKWARIRGGVFLDGKEEFDERKLQEKREDRMSKLLCFDVKSEEEFWVDYLDEESQSKLDLADLVLDVLLKETVDVVMKGVNI